jgi:SPP1 family predicted phage head-tail adaptor
VDNSTLVVANDVAAKVTQLAGLELIRAHQVAAEVTHEIRIRYRPGMTTRHSIKYDGKTFDINNVNDIEGQHKELILLCKGVG